jgi:hypothetical protein
MALPLYIFLVMGGIQGLRIRFSCAVVFQGVVTCDGLRFPSALFRV